MNRRVLAGLCALLALVAVVGQTYRASGRLRTSRLLKAVEAVTPRAARAGLAGRPVLARQLQLLTEAEKGEPTNVAVVTAKAAQLYVLERFDDAEAEYRRALLLEPRGEIWLNLGRSLWQKGDRVGAADAFRRALALTPRLAGEVPPGALAERS